MSNIKILMGWGILLCIMSCNDRTKTISIAEPKILHRDTTANIQQIPKTNYDTSQWTELTSENGMLFDIRYASDNNFTHNQIYDCGRCFLRPELATKINQMHQDIKKRYGYALKMFDCYRPRPAQQKLWDIVPNAMYVTPPKKGSMHNRGLAVDLTIVDENGEELNMGTEYDFFGTEAHRTYNHPDPNVRKNRKLHRLLLEAHGLTGIRTEWWHYSLKTVSYDFSSWEWPCE